MSKIKRYDLVPEDTGVFVEEIECDDGEWVQYDDIEHLLNTSDNSDKDHIVTDNTKVNAKLIEQNRVMRAEIDKLNLIRWKYE